MSWLQKEAELSAETQEVTSEKASAGVLKETNSPQMDPKNKKPYSP